MDDVPIRKITLYNCGLALIEREVTNNTNSEITLKVKKEFFNDVLKSITIIEKGKGLIHYCTYPTPPIKSNFITQDSDNTSHQRSLLSIVSDLIGKRLRIYLGESGKVVGYASQASAIIGSIVQYFHSETEYPDNYSTTSILFLRENTNQLLSIKLNQIAGIEVLDEDFIQELRTEIKLKADKENSLITLYLDGEQHDLIIRYTTPATPWRISYRLLLDNETEFTSTNRAMLQGLIIYDNDTNEDLYNVVITFVSNTPALVNSELYLGRHTIDLQKQFINADLVHPYVSYSMKESVSISKGDSALFPIFSVNIPYKDLLIYDPDISSKYALKSVKLINNSSIDLIGGQVSIYRYGEYLGESLIVNSLNKGDEIILSYDYEDRVTIESNKSELKEVQGFSIDGDVLITFVNNNILVEYSITNKNKYDVFIIIKATIPEGFELVEPQIINKGPNNDAFIDIMLAGETEKKLQVLYRRIDKQTKQLSEISSEDLAMVISHPSLEPSLKSSLERLQEIKNDLHRFQERLDILKNFLENETLEQTRIRKNYAILKDGEIESILKNVYVQELWESEKRYDNYKKEIMELTNKINDLHISRIELINSIGD